MAHKDLDVIQVVDPTNQDSRENIMNLFGVDPFNNTIQGVALLEEIASHWDHKVKNGLENKEIQNLDIYPPKNKTYSQSFRIKKFPIYILFR